MFASHLCCEDQFVDASFLDNDVLRVAYYDEDDPDNTDEPYFLKHLLLYVFPLMYVVTLPYS